MMSNHHHHHQPPSPSSSASSSSSSPRNYYRPTTASSPSSSSIDITTVKTPFTVPSNVNIQILSFGRLHKGTNHAKYKRRRNNEYLHPLPIGYHATIKIHDHTFDMKIKEGENGPVYQVRDMKTKRVFRGQSATEPWTEIYESMSFVAAPVGPGLFGFSDEQVQNILRSMEKEANETNIVFYKSEDAASPRRNSVIVTNVDRKQTMTKQIQYRPSSTESNHDQTATNNEYHENDKMTKHNLHFHGMTPEQWLELLGRYKLKINSEIEALGMRVNRLRTKNNKRSRPVDDLTRQNEKRQKVDNHSTLPRESQEYDMMLDTTLLNLVSNSSRSSRADSHYYNNNIAQVVVNNSVVDKQINAAEEDDPEPVTTCVPESQFVESEVETKQKFDSIRHRLTLESEPYVEITDGAAIESHSFTETLVVDYTNETNILQSSPKGTQNNENERVDHVVATVETQLSIDDTLSIINHITEEKDTRANQSIINTTINLSPELIQDNVQKSMNKSSSTLFSSGNVSLLLDDDHTIDLETLCSPVPGRPANNLFDEKQDDLFQTVEIHLDPVSSKGVTQDDDDDDRVIDDETVTDIRAVVQALPRGESEPKQKVIIGSCDLLAVLSGTQVPTSPKGVDLSTSSDEDDHNVEDDPGSPIIGSLSPDTDEDDPTQVDTVDQQENDRVDNATNNVNNSTLGTSTPVPSYVKPKMSQHSLPRHAITKINTQNPLLVHSKFSLHQPVQSIRFSPNPALATFAACTSKFAAVWDLNKETWEMIEEFEFKQEGECISNIQYTPDGEKLIVAGIFADSVQVSQDFTLSTPPTQYNYTSQIRVYELTGESMVRHAMRQKIDPILTLKGHQGKILDMIASSNSCCLISTDETGIVLKHTFDEEWTQREEVIELSQTSINRADATTKQAVVSLSFVPGGGKFQRLLVGFTRSSAILWDYMSCRCIQNITIPIISIFKGYVVGVQLEEPNSGIIPVLVFRQNTLNQDDQGVKRTGMFFVGHSFSSIRQYQRSETPQSQSTHPSTQPCRDNILALTVHPNTASRYLVSGTDRGRILIFNYRTSQCVGIMMDMHEEPISALDFHEHLPLLAVGGQNGTLLVYYQSV